MESCTQIARTSSPIRVRNIARRASLAAIAGGLAAAAAILPLAVGIARPERARAPRGGVVVSGHFYRPGSYLPSPRPEGNPRDSWPAWTDEERWTVAVPEQAPAAAPAVEPEPEPALVSINGFVYSAKEIPIAAECGSVAFELTKRDTNNRYHVHRDPSGLVRCDCPDYEFRHEGTAQMCKHGSRLVAMGLIPSPDPDAARGMVRELVGPYCSVLRDATPRRVDYPAPTEAEAEEAPARRRRRFEPTPQEMAEAAQLVADLAAAF